AGSRAAVFVGVELSPHRRCRAGARAREAAKARRHTGTSWSRADELSPRTSGERCGRRVFALGAGRLVNRADADLRVYAYSAGFVGGGARGRAGACDAHAGSAAGAGATAGVVRVERDAGGVSGGKKPSGRKPTGEARARVV